MKIAAVVSFLESLAHPSLQESYDNAGLLTGSESWNCSGIICCLDATEEVINEAIAKKANLVVAHHPIIFGGLKKINGKNYVERAVIAAIKNDIAIYAIHTNLDNVIDGVSGRMAQRLGLTNTRVLAPKSQVLRKLYTFVPVDHAEKVKTALFEAGAGHIGKYSECSFTAEGMGSFKPLEGSQPFVGKQGVRQEEREGKLEVIFPAYLEGAIVMALQTAHPYEEVAYDLVTVANTHRGTGSGLVGELPGDMEEGAFLTLLKSAFELQHIRHTPFTNNRIRTVAICGGAGSFLIHNALRAGAQVFISADIKYHEFFDADGKMLVADIGHYESERYTIDLLQEVLAEKFTTFAVLKTGVNTNPVMYFT